MRALFQSSITLFLLAALMACRSTAPPAVENSDWTRQRLQLEQLDSWQFRGRVNVRYNNDSHTPSIQWLQQSNEYSIRLWGTFNAGNTQIVGRPGYVTLEQDGEVNSANSPEQLILQELGYELPVSFLEYWIKGIPSPNATANLEFNELNQLISMEQAGWMVTYIDPRQYGPYSLPARIELSRPENDILLRFFGLRWTLDQSLL